MVAMTFFRRSAVVVLALLAAGEARAQQPSQAEVAAGRVMALKFCTPCHVVTADQEFSPIFTGPPKPPDFRAIAARPNTSTESLREFLATTHATATLPIHMANPGLTDDQTAKIVAFILSLRSKR